jgi:hypothetical protein
MHAHTNPSRVSRTLAQPFLSLQRLLVLGDEAGLRRAAPTSELTDMLDGL